MLGKVVQNMGLIGIILGFLLNWKRIYETYFGTQHELTTRPGAGILLFVYTVIFAAKIGRGFFRIIDLMIFRINRFFYMFFSEGRNPSRIRLQVFSILLQVVMGVGISTCIIVSWKKMVILSECLQDRSCDRFPLSWLLETKFYICPKLSNLPSMYYELACEDILDMVPLFIPIALTAAFTFFIAALQVKMRSRQYGMKLEGSNDSQTSR